MFRQAIHLLKTFLYQTNTQLMTFWFLHVSSVILYFCRYKPTHFKAGEKTIMISFECNSCQLFLRWLFQQSVVVFTVSLLVLFCFYYSFMWCACICLGIVCPFHSYVFCEVLPPFVLYCTMFFLQPVYSLFLLGTFYPIKKREKYPYCIVMPWYNFCDVAKVIPLPGL